MSGRFACWVVPSARQVVDLEFLLVTLLREALRGEVKWFSERGCHPSSFSVSWVNLCFSEDAD